MTTLNWLDYAIIIIIALSIIISLIRGFVREALSLASWIVAFWVALSFSTVLETYFQPYIQSDSLRYAAAFAVLFLATLLVGALVNFAITQLIHKTGLSGTDRLLGVIFGFARGVLLVAIVLLAARMTEVTKEPIWMQSQLIPMLTPVENWLSNYIPKNIQDQLPKGNALLDAQNAVVAQVSSVRNVTNDAAMMNAATTQTTGQS